MIKVKLAVEIPENWVRKISRSAKVKIVNIKKGEGYVEDLVEFSPRKLSPEELISHLRKEGGIISSDVTKVNKDRIVGFVKTHDCPVCSIFGGLDCFLLSAYTRDDGKMEWTLLTASNNDVKTLCGRLDSNKVNYKILEVSHKINKRTITARQEEILRIAFELGYFDFPKKIKLQQLASKIGITPGTLSEILRRAEKNVLTNYFYSESVEST